MKRWIGAGLIGLALAGCGGSSSGGTGTTASNSTPPPPAANALFQVGAAVVNINPTAPVYVGGYSNPSEPAIQTVNDPLEVRAFVVANGNKAVAFAVVDSTGWFGEYQDQSTGYGQFGARVDAASKLASHGFSVDRTDVMVSTTHSHATPTMVGIWGDMGPANQAYVKQVHDAVVSAVDQAASNMKTSELWFSNGDISSIIWQNGGGTDHVDGFPVDARMPVLWARDPNTGATNAIYVNIPNHPDEFRAFNGSVTQGFGADVPGYVRSVMDASVGGVSVVASGTLGRQESPGEAVTYAEVGHQGDYVANALRLAMANAQPLKSNQIGGAETQVQLSVGSTTSNQGLLTLMKYNAATGPFGGPSCNSALGGMCSIPRALTAPWCEGNCTVSGTGSSTLGTYMTALRIGPLLYVSNPGESFAEVNDAIRSDVLDAQSVNVVGLAGDFLGYNWVTSDYTPLQFGSSDFATYNIGPDLAQNTANAGYANAASLGFKVQTAPTTVHAVFNPNIANLPGIQFYPSQVETALNTISFYGSTAQPQNNYGKANDTLSPLNWNFGDNNAGTSNPGDRFTHLYYSSGLYGVSASVTDGNTGLSRSWSQSIKIDEPLQVSIAASNGSGGNHNLSLTSAGGQGTLIAALWTCTDGSAVQGLTVSCPPGNGSVKVTATDGAGNSAQTSITFSH